MITPLTKNAPGTGGNRSEGNDINPTQINEQENVMTRMPDPTDTVQPSVALAAWITRTAESVTTLAATALDPVSAGFPEPSWSRGHGPDGDEPATVRARPSERISVSESAAVPLLRAAGRETGGRVSFSSADVRVAQRHTDRDPHVQLRRRAFGTAADAPALGQWLDLLSLRTCEARQLGEVLVAAADLAEGRDPATAPAPADPADIRSRAQLALQRVIDATESEVVETEAMPQGLDAAPSDAQLRWAHATQARIASTSALLALVDEALASTARSAVPSATGSVGLRERIVWALDQATMAGEVQGAVQVVTDLDRRKGGSVDEEALARSTARTRKATEAALALFDEALTGTPTTTLTPGPAAALADINDALQAALDRADEEGAIWHELTPRAGADDVRLQQARQRTRDAAAAVMGLVAAALAATVQPPATPGPRIDSADLDEVFCASQDRRRDLNEAVVPMADVVDVRDGVTR